MPTSTMFFVARSLDAWVAVGSLQAFDWPSLYVTQKAAEAAFKGIGPVVRLEATRADEPPLRVLLDVEREEKARWQKALAAVHQAAGRGDGHGSPEATAACIVSGIGTRSMEAGEIEAERDVLEEQLRKEQACIQAMHHRPWWRVGILRRRPWRSPTRRWPGEPLLGYLWAWLFVKHDCQDPAVGCSCQGGFRFPKALS
jgi:hypothetical protein